MTKAEARTTLGITGSANRSEAALVYEEKCKKLRLKMVPGMPEATRHKAYAELARLIAAWRILQPISAAPRRQRKRAYRKPPIRRPVSKNSSQRPQTLGEAWEEVLSMMPFPEPVVAMVIIAVFLLVIASLFKTL